MISLVILFVILFIVVIAHETGHFLVAGLLGRPISSVEIGTGPLLCQFQYRSSIWFRVHLVPMSGNIKLVYLSKKPWKNIAVFAAGPLANFVLAASAWFVWWDLAVCSLVIGLINCIPFKESDGSGIAKEFRKIKATAVNRGQVGR